MSKQLDAALASRSRFEDWSLADTGWQIWPLVPRLEDINIQDVAHHLSLICRVTRTMCEHNSIPQHSILFGLIFPGHLQFDGLMHDSPDYAFTRSNDSLKLRNSLSRLQADISSALSHREVYEMRFP